MNVTKMKLAIEARLGKIECHDQSKRKWIPPVALATTGIACLVTSAVMPLAAIHTGPIIASAMGGTALGSLIAASTLTKAGLAICGTALPIPLAIPVAISGATGASLLGGSAWLWELTHRSVSIWALGLHWFGIGLLAAGVVWGAYRMYKYIANKHHYAPEMCVAV